MKIAEIKKIEIKILSKKYFWLLTFLFSILYSLFSPVYPAFKDVGWGARPLGLAGAFTAISDDSNAVLFNPAGLSQIYLNQFEFMYGRPFAGLESVDINYYLLTGAINISQKCKLGIGYINFTTKNLYREDTALVSFSYAPQLTDFKESIGLTVKWLYHCFVPDEYTKNDIVFLKTTDKSALSFDLGLIAVFFNKLKFGISAKEINQPDVGLKDKDIVPYSLNIGLGWKHDTQASKFIFAIETSQRNNDYNINFGIESWLSGDKLGIRIGANLTEIALGTTYRFNVSPTLSVEISYAFVWPVYIQETYGTHRLSVGIRF